MEFGKVNDLKRFSKIKKHEFIKGKNEYIRPFESIVDFDVWCYVCGVKWQWFKICSQRSTISTLYYNISKYTDIILFDVTSL